MTTIADVERAAGFSVRVAVIDYYMHDGVSTHISRPSAAAASSASSSGFPFAHSSSAGQRKPVVRIFGATPAGQKSCVHVHGVFPYFFVALGANLDDLLSQPGGAQGYLASMQASIEKAVSVSSRQTNNAGDGGGKGNGGKGGGGKGHGGEGWGGKGNGGKGRGGGGGFGASAAGRGWGRGGFEQKCVQKLQLVDGRRFYGYHGSTEPFVRVSVRMILHSYYQTLIQNIRRLLPAR